MNRIAKAAIGLVGLISADELFATSEASARGGGSNFMNSPGYQRRLQESRGYVTNQSGSIFSNSTVTPRAYRDRRHRSR